jgi:hypothetical protein
MTAAQTEAGEPSGEHSGQRGPADGCSICGEEPEPFANPVGRRLCGRCRFFVVTNHAMGFDGQ